MKVAEKDVRYVEDLANLELTAEERARMVRDLNSILEYMDRLNQLDTANVPPMAQVAEGQGAGGTAKFAHAMREDKPLPSLAHEDALRNTPETDGNFFKVPKVIER